MSGWMSVRSGWITLISMKQRRAEVLENIERDRGEGGSAVRPMHGGYDRQQASTERSWAVTAVSWKQTELRVTPVADVAGTSGR